MNGGDSLLTVCIPDLLGQYTLHIPKTFLHDAHPTVEEIPSLFDQIELVRILGERGRHSLCSASQRTMREDTTEGHRGGGRRVGFRRNIVSIHPASHSVSHPVVTSSDRFVRSPL